MDYAGAGPHIFRPADIRFGCFGKDGRVFYQSKRGAIFYLCIYSGAFCTHYCRFIVTDKCACKELSGYPAGEEPVQHGNDIYFLAFSGYCMDISICFFTFEPILKQPNSSTDEYSSITD